MGDPLGARRARRVSDFVIKTDFRMDLGDLGLILEQQLVSAGRFGEYRRVLGSHGDLQRRDEGG